MDLAGDRRPAQGNSPLQLFGARASSPTLGTLEPLADGSAVLGRSLGFWELVRRSAGSPARHICARLLRLRGAGADAACSAGAPLRRGGLVLGFGPSIRVDGERRSSFVAGLHGSPAVTEHDGVQEGLQVNLTPLGAYRLFGPPVRGVPGQVVDLEDLLGASAGLPRRAALRVRGMGSPLRAPRCSALPPARGASARVARRRVGVAPPRGDRGTAADRDDHGGARLQPPAPDDPLPRADRPPAQSVRANPALRPRRPQAPERRRRESCRDRSRIRLLRPVALQPGLPRLCGSDSHRAGRARAARRPRALGHLNDLSREVTFVQDGGEERS